MWAVVTSFHPRPLLSGRSTLWGGAFFGTWVSPSAGPPPPPPVGGRPLLGRWVGGAGEALGLGVGSFSFVTVQSFSVAVYSIALT